MGKIILNDNDFAGMTISDKRDSDEYHWFFNNFIPYVISLQSKHPEIDYMSYIPYDVLLRYIQKDLNLSQAAVMLELNKRKPDSVIKDITNIIK